jgi:hypothetical protein
VTHETTMPAASRATAAGTTDAARGRLFPVAVLPLLFILFTADLDEPAGVDASP